MEINNNIKPNGKAVISTSGRNPTMWSSCLLEAGAKHYEDPL